MKIGALQICLIDVSIPNKEKGLNISWHWGWSITWRWVFLLRWFHKWTFVRIERFPFCGIRWGNLRLWLGWFLLELCIQHNMKGEVV